MDLNRRFIWHGIGKVCSNLRKFFINKEPHEIGVQLFQKSEININEGITVLVGCNGIGKTTLINTIKDEIKKNKIPMIHFNNLQDGDQNARAEAMYYQDYQFLADTWTASEGENIVVNLGIAAKKIGLLLRENSNAKELWILLDACDSGLSVDNVVELKTFFRSTVIPDNKEKRIYVIIAANEYEMTNGEQCFDVYNGEHITFNDYDEYREMILESRRQKDRRAKI